MVHILFKERQKYHYKKSEYRRTDFVGGEDFRENILKYGAHVVERERIKLEHIISFVGIGISYLLQGNHLKKEQLEEDRKLIAYHEAGHAVMSYLLHRRIARINIESNTSGVGGFVLQEDTESCFQTKREMEEQIYICYAGRISEESFFGRENCTNGAANDIENATKMLRQYIVQYGFSDTFGMNNLDILQGQQWLLPFQIWCLRKDECFQYLFAVLLQNQQFV